MGGDKCVSANGGARQKTPQVGGKREKKETTLGSIRGGFGPYKKRRGENKNRKGKDLGEETGPQQPHRKA